MYFISICLFYFGTIAAIFLFAIVKIGDVVLRKGSRVDENAPLKTRLQVKHSQIIISLVNIEETLGPFSLSWRIAEGLTTSVLVITKCASSLGQRLYSLFDLFFNKHYVFSESIFNPIPDPIKYSIIFLSALGDSHMNGLTRGSSTRRLVKTLFGMLSAVKKPSTFVTCRLMALKIFVFFCGVMSSISASLVTFLGISTLIGHATDNFWGKMIPGSFAAIANFMSNISYRVRKAIDNLRDIVNRKLRQPTKLEVLIILLSSGAFLGQCQYGAEHSMRNLLALLGIYNGDPDAGTDVDATYESWILFLADVTLPTSFVSYILSQSVSILSEPPPDSEKERQITLKDMRLAYIRKIKSSEEYLKYSCCHPVRWLPPFTGLFMVTLGNFFIFFEMLGNALSTFNGTNGLIVRWFTDNHWVVGPVSLILVFTNSLIYWKYNIIGWKDTMIHMYVMSQLWSLRKLGFCNSDDQLILYEQLGKLVFPDLEIGDENDEDPAPDIIVDKVQNLLDQPNERLLENKQHASDQDDEHEYQSIDQQNKDSWCERVMSVCCSFWKSNGSARVPRPGDALLADGESTIYTPV